MTILEWLHHRINAEHKTLPPLWKIRSSKWFIICTAAMAVFTDLFLYGLIVTTLPFQLGNRAGIAEGEIQQWISILLAVFGVAYLVASPFVGYLTDLSPTRRLPYLVGGVILTAATLLLCFARSIAVLIIARMIQGASCSVAWIVGPAMIADSFADASETGKALGFVGIASGLAIILGPLLGGVLYAAGGYYAPYGIAFGILCIDLFLRFFVVEPKSIAHLRVGINEQEQDAGDVEVEAGRNDEKNTQPSPEPVTIHEAKTAPNPDSVRMSQDKQDAVDTAPSEQDVAQAVMPEPVMPTWDLLKSERVLAAAFATISVSTLLISFDAVLPLRVSELFGWGSIGAGCIYIALCTPAFFAPLAGMVVDRYGARWLLTIGFAMAVPSFVCLRFVDHEGIGQKVLLCVLLFLCGVSISACLTPITAELSFVVGAKEKAQPGIYGKKGGMAQVYGIYNVAFALGTIIGPLWGGYVRDSAGWATMAWSFSILAGVTSVVTLLWTGGAIYKRPISRSFC